MNTMFIESAAKRIPACGYLYTWHYLRYDMKFNRYDALRIIWAAKCYNAVMEGWI